MKHLTVKVIAFLVAGCLALLVSCGKDNVSTAGGEKTGRGVTLRLLTRMSGADPGTMLLEQVKKEFKEKYPDITIQDESKNDSNAFTQQFVTDIASGNVADILHWPGISIMKEYAQTGVFLDLTDLVNNSPDVKNNVDSTLLNMMELSAIGVPGIYALPITNQMEVFYYNTDLFAKAGIEGPPQTWDEFYIACDKLLDIGVIPWSLGANNKWRAVHVHTGLTYKICGVQKASDLGSRKAKWTDSDVMAIIGKIKEIADRGYFGRDYAGIDYETEKARFIRGETAMSFDGSWRIGEIPEDVLAHTATFRMPFFTDRPQFKDHDIAYPSQLELGGHLKDEPEKLQYVWEFATMFVDKPRQEAYLYQVSNVPVRTDLVVEESRLNPLLAQLINFKNNEIRVWGSDVWAYDTLAIMEDVVGDAMVGALTGMSAQNASRQIQTRLEEAER
jgi:raffinose/stachyose/melibiose transport system substrate-binding protein